MLTQAFRADVKVSIILVQHNIPSVSDELTNLSEHFLGQ